MNLWCTTTKTKFVKPIIADITIAKLLYIHRDTYSVMIGIGILRTSLPVNYMCTHLLENGRLEKH